MSPERGRGAPGHQDAPSPTSSARDGSGHAIRPPIPPEMATEAEAVAAKDEMVAKWMARLSASGAVTVQRPIDEREGEER